MRPELLLETGRSSKRYDGKRAQRLQGRIGGDFLQYLWNYG
jgi:hypothetical protein